MEADHNAGQVLAFFAGLASAEAMLHALQAAGTPYPAIQLAAHSANELGSVALQAPSTHGQLWSLAVLLEPAWRAQALATLHAGQPFAITYPDSISVLTDETERGALAWRHYVFESGAASDVASEAGDGAGTTGVVNSGAFAEDALAEGNPPTRHTPASDERPSDKGEQPSADTLRPELSRKRSRPQTELHE